MQCDDQSSEQSHDRRTAAGMAAKPVEVWLTDQARVGQAGNTSMQTKCGSRPRAARGKLLLPLDRFHN